jgi:hypothetical protein
MPHVSDATTQSKTLSDAYIGSARVSLQNLVVEDSSMCDVDRTKIRALRRLFKLDGCRRLEPQNRIPVLLCGADILEMLRQVQLSESSLKASLPPRFNLPGSYKFKYLSGQGFHRLAAAELSLKGSERWWCVNFYRAEGLQEMSPGSHEGC